MQKAINLKTTFMSGSPITLIYNPFGQWGGGYPIGWYIIRRVGILRVPTIKRATLFALIASHEGL